MAQRTSHREEETVHTNGVAKDASFAKTAEVVKRHPELQGYILMAAGLALTLFAFGIAPILKWAIVAVGVVTLLAGIVQSNIIARIANSIERYRTRHK